MAHAVATCTRLCLVADELRRRQAGDVVAYVVNRNVNFTNVCVKTCKFCAFSRDLRSEQGYLLTPRRSCGGSGGARLRRHRGLHSGGLAARGQGSPTWRSARGQTGGTRAPHPRVFAREIKYGAALARTRARVSARAQGCGPWLLARHVGGDSRRPHPRPHRARPHQHAAWIEVITTAHALGIPTTATMMFGHVETALDRMRHLALLRAIQKDTGGFTEFVPLSFVHAEAPLFFKQEWRAVSAGPRGDDVVRLYAIARLMLGATFKNLQASWVKEGLRTAQWLLSCGVNDLGGTLMNESISTAAGAQHGQLVAPRAYVDSSATAAALPPSAPPRYDLLRVFDGNTASDDAREPLDLGAAIRTLCSAAIRTAERSRAFTTSGARTSPQRSLSRLPERAQATPQQAAQQAECQQRTHQSPTSRKASAVERLHLGDEAGLLEGLRARQRFARGALKLDTPVLTHAEVAACLDGAQTRHHVVERRLVAVAEPGVVGHVHEHLGAALHDFAARVGKTGPRNRSRSPRLISPGWVVPTLARSSRITSFSPASKPREGKRSRSGGSSPRAARTRQTRAAATCPPDPRADRPRARARPCCSSVHVAQRRVGDGTKE